MKRIFFTRDTVVIMRKREACPDAATCFGKLDYTDKAVSLNHVISTPVLWTQLLLAYRATIAGESTPETIIASRKTIMYAREKRKFLQ